MAPPGQRLARRAPFSLTRKARGSAPGPPLSWHPASVKRVNRVEERKLLPESVTIWDGPTILLDNSRFYPRTPGRNSHSFFSLFLSLSRCANITGGKGRGYQSIEAPQITEPSINTPPPSTLALSSPFSLPNLFPLSRSQPHTRPLRVRDGAATAPLRVERSLT